MSGIFARWGISKPPFFKGVNCVSLLKDFVSKYKTLNLMNEAVFWENPWVLLHTKAQV